VCAATVSAPRRTSEASSRIHAAIDPEFDVGIEDRDECVEVAVA
jgi:hypothetical protein